MHRMLCILLKSTKISGGRITIMEYLLKGYFVRDMKHYLEV